MFKASEIRQGLTVNEQMCLNIVKNVNYSCLDVSVSGDFIQLTCISKCNKKYIQLRLLSSDREIIVERGKLHPRERLATISIYTNIDCLDTIYSFIGDMYTPAGQSNIIPLEILNQSLIMLPRVCSFKSSSDKVWISNKETKEVFAVCWGTSDEKCIYTLKKSTNTITQKRRASDIVKDLLGVF